MTDAERIDALWEQIAGWVIEPGDGAEAAVRRVLAAAIQDVRRDAASKGGKAKRRPAPKPKKGK